MRLQLALNVSDIDQAVAYYSALFDVEPHKRRERYANFVVQQPPLKLVLFENPGAADRLNHLGVEVHDADDVSNAAERFKAQGILDLVEENTTCCHATQDKAWSQEPDGLRWEWYRITEDEPDAAALATDPAVRSKDGVCCA